MDAVTDLFSQLCGQGRCFIVDGAALPVCQRCFGLYAGAALTTGWLLLARTWRCGLPNRGPGWVEGIALLAAMLGGLHVLDMGPAWRLACGLWTGHVVVLWLTGAAAQLAQASQPDLPILRPWRGWHDLQLLAAPPLLAAAACLFTTRMAVGWHVWAALPVAGAACLATVTLWVAACLATWTFIASHRCRS
jgi:uncharacterized membrane protein